MKGSQSGSDDSAALQSPAEAEQPTEPAEASFLDDDCHEAGRTIVGPKDLPLYSISVEGTFVCSPGYIGVGGGDPLPFSPGARSVAVPSSSKLTRQGPASSDKIQAPPTSLRASNS